MTQQPQQTKPSPARPRSAETEWKGVAKWVRVYGWLTAAVVLLGSVFLAHPGLLGWGSSTTCQSSGCVLAMHLIEVPLIAYLLFVALYSVVRANHLTATRFWGLLGFANVVQLVFFLFEGVLLVSSFRSEGTLSEKVISVATMSLLLAGVSLGGWIRFRVNEYLHPPLDPRFEHPRTEGELIQLVKKARAYKVQLRVRGSAHCVQEGIYADEGGPHINVQLDRYTQIVKFDEFEEENRALVTVQAGCHLGVDPHDLLSNKKNSLLWQLDKRGWALPDLGGITHQTVSGFLSTGSMGGTMQYNLGGALVGIRIIDGTGKVHDLAPDPNDPKDEEHNPFYAAGVSMGLLGIVSTLTFQCERRYYLEGEQVISTTKDFTASLVERGKGGLEGYFADKRNQYTRLLWWPQPGIDKVERWTARREVRCSRSLKEWTKVVLTRRRRFNRRPLAGIPSIIQRLLIHPFYNYISKDELPYEPRTQTLVLNVLGLFVRTCTKRFRDVWYKVLPLDNHISEKLVRTDFTELFIDISQADRVMNILSRFFCPIDEKGKEDKKGKEAAIGMARTGAYVFEIYPGHKSRFWMSPSYGRHSVRLDVFWFRTDDIEGRERFFKQFWELLRKKNINFRLHWGKYLPKADSLAGADYLRMQYPRWRKFMEVRRRMDPDGIFLSTYWREHLGLVSSSLVRRPVATRTPELRRRTRLYPSIEALKLFFRLRAIVDRQPSAIH